MYNIHTHKTDTHPYAHERIFVLVCDLLARRIVVVLGFVQPSAILMLGVACQLMDRTTLPLVVAVVAVAGPCPHHR